MGPSLPRVVSHRAVVFGFRACGRVYGGNGGRTSNTGDLSASTLPQENKRCGKNIHKNSLLTCRQVGALVVILVGSTPKETSSLSVTCPDIGIPTADIGMPTVGVECTLKFCQKPASAPVSAPVSGLETSSRSLSRKTSKPLCSSRECF